MIHWLYANLHYVLVQQNQLLAKVVSTCSLNIQMLKQYKDCPYMVNNNLTERFF